PRRPMIARGIAARGIGQASSRMARRSVMTIRALAAAIVIGCGWCEHGVLVRGSLAAAARGVGAALLGPGGVWGLFPTVAGAAHPSWPKGRGPVGAVPRLCLRVDPAAMARRSLGAGDVGVDHGWGRTGQSARQRRR